MMINDNSAGYRDYANEIEPQRMGYGDPGTINVGGMGPNPPITGTPGASTPNIDADYYFNAQFAPDFLHNSQGTAYPNPIFSANQPNPNFNPLTAYGPPASLAPSSQTPGNQSTPNPFMTPGMTFQPRTQFGQQASAPLNINQQGRTYGQMPGGPNMAQQPPAFQSVRPGGSSGFMPQFQNPFGPQTQPQQYRSMGQQPTQISQQPQAPRQPDADGIAALLRNATQNR